MAERMTRKSETREAESRTRAWTRPDALPTPDPEEGYHFRWIRTSMMGQPDNKNVSTRFREGYVPVKASDYPELKVISDHDSRFPDNIEVGGLMLCKIPQYVIDDRNRQMDEQSARQIEAVDRSYLRQSDPRMPVLKPERSSRTSFGEG